MHTSPLAGVQPASERRVATVIAAQHGVLHRRQALDTGFTRKMVESRLERGVWERMHPAVYRSVEVPVSWRQRLMAAVLSVDGVASHRSAAALWGLDGAETGRVEITLVGTGGRLLTGATIHRTRALADADRTEVDGIAVTRPARTLVDLASVLSAERLEEALDSALREGMVSVAHLGRRLAALGSRGRAGTAALSALLEDRSGQRPADSRRELRTTRLLITAGLPPAVRQHEVRDEQGLLLARFDLAYPDRLIGVEYDSYRHHFGRSSWRRDRERHNRVTALGWLVLHLTGDDVSAVATAYRARVAASVPWRMQAATPTPR